MHYFAEAFHQAAARHFEWWWLLIIFCSLGLAVLAKWLSKKHQDQENNPQD